MTLDVARTRQLAETFAARLGLSVEQLALGIVRIANANMERAVRVVSVQRGHDPRDFALLGFAGAGGLHACDLAASLDIVTVLVPAPAGVLSALGMLLADVKKDSSAALLMDASLLRASQLDTALHPLLLKAESDVAHEGFGPERCTFEAALAMRYKGQSFEIDVLLAVDSKGQVSEAALAATLAGFHDRQQRLYGYSRTDRPTEAVHLRLRAVGRTPGPELADSPEPPPARPVPDLYRETTWGEAQVSTPVFHRDRLTAGAAAEGPAIVISGEATSLVPPGWTWRIDSAGTLVGRRLHHDANSEQESTHA